MRRLTEAGLLVAGAAGGCARYEYRTIDCRADAPPAAASAIAWQAAAGETGRLTLRAIAAGTGAAVPTHPFGGARVDTSAWRRAGPDGAVRFDSLSSGPHAVEVRATGHHGAHATVVVQPDSGVQALAAMALGPLTINEACGFMMRGARKPWWKP